MNFSVLISCFCKDSPLFFKQALNSIKNQTLQPSEVLLVEDGKLTRELNDIILVYKKILPIKQLKLPYNIGLGAALNKGLLECSWDLVLRMDTDDICHPTRFEKQVEFFKNNPEVDILGTWARDIDGYGNFIKNRIYPISHDKLIKIIWTCPIIHPTVAYKKKSILSIGSYRTDLSRRQDYEMWLRAASKGLKFANLSEVLLDYRFTNDYYKKNNVKVAWSQAMLGVKGLNNLEQRSIYAYIGVFFPVFRALLPNFIGKPFNKVVRKIDPRLKD